MVSLLRQRVDLRWVRWFHWSRNLPNWCWKFQAIVTTVVSWFRAGLKRHPPCRSCQWRWLRHHSSRYRQWYCLRHIAIRWWQRWWLCHLKWCRMMGVRKLWDPESSDIDIEGVHHSYPEIREWLKTWINHESSDLGFFVFSFFFLLAEPMATAISCWYLNINTRSQIFCFYFLSLWYLDFNFMLLNLSLCSCCFCSRYI